MITIVYNRNKSNKTKESERNMNTPKYPELVVNLEAEKDFEKIYREQYEEDAIV